MLLIILVENGRNNKLNDFELKRGKRVQWSTSDRETEGQRDRETERQRDRETEKERQRQRKRTAPECKCVIVCVR